MPMSGSKHNPVGSQSQDPVVRPDRTAELEAALAVHHVNAKAAADRIDALEALLTIAIEAGYISPDTPFGARIAAAIKDTP
jgi:hypothetical protein